MKDGVLESTDGFTEMEGSVDGLIDNDGFPDRTCDGPIEIEGPKEDEGLTDRNSDG